MSVLIHIGRPVCADDGKHKLHAADGARPKTRRKTYDAACGARVRLLAFPVLGTPDRGITALWPPYKADAAEWGYDRCQDCMALHPGKPVRPNFTPKEAE